VLNDGQSIGQLKRISSMFSFCAPEEYQNTNIRLHSELEPTGCLGDLGWYDIRLSLWAMNWQLPQAVSGRILSQRGSNTSPAPTPTDFSGELIFNEITSAGFHCSFLTAFQQWGILSGTKGSLYIPDFVHPSNIHEPSFEVNNTHVRVKCCNCMDVHTESRVQAQDTNMIRNFANQILSGKLNDEWPMMSLKTQQVLDACFESAKNGGRLTLL
jgi:predicted dehydrogenase